MALQLQKHPVLISEEGHVGLQLTGPSGWDRASRQSITLVKEAKVFAIGLWHSADLQHLDTGWMTAVCFLPPWTQLCHHSKASLQTEQHRRLLAPCPCKTLGITLGMLQISWTCPGHSHSVFSAGLACLLYLLSSTHAAKNRSVHALWPPLQPPQVFGRLFLWPPWWKSQRNRQCLRFHSQFLEGSTSGETQMCGRHTDLNHQWVKLTVAWGSLHYGKYLPGDKKIILHCLF